LRLKAEEPQFMTELSEPTRWSLQDLLSATSGTEFDQIVTDLDGKVTELEGWRERLTPDLAEDDFVRLMQLYESITEAGNRLYAYARLWFAENTQSQEALGFLGRMEQLITDVQNRVLFFTLWWKELDDKAAARLLAVSGDWQYYLESLRRFKPHTLSEPEERVINLKDVNGQDALNTLYDIITNKYVFRLEVDGEAKELTRAELTRYVQGPSAALREAAYRELHRVFAHDGNVLGQIYIHRVRDWKSENLTLRQFGSPIAVRNLSNDIPDTVVDTLLQVCRQNVDVFQHYFRLKAGWLGIDRLKRFDIYAPLTTAEKEYPYHQAVRIVLDSLAAFSPILAEHAKRVFADGHIDSEIRDGKESGAFCFSVLPGVTPWVLANYTGMVRDVATLAHELGHAIHAMMASDHSILTLRSALPLAETASVFSEMVLTDRLLEEEPDVQARRDLLAAAVDDAYATVMRQAYFVLFERQAHAMIAEGKTTDDLRKVYMKNLLEQFGDAVEMDEIFQWEWVSIPHIYQTPFYCYAYTFGQLLVLSLYQRYKEEGASFIPRYLKILSYGGSESPEHILSEAGVDMEAAGFWQGGFDVIRAMVDELAALPSGSIESN
jgi:oligoendopeptidase F